MNLRDEMLDVRSRLDDLLTRINNEGLSIETNGVREQATGSIAASLNYTISGLTFYIKKYADPVVPDTKPREH